MYLKTLANLAEIMTAAVALVVSCYLGYGKYRKRINLEQYLKSEKPTSHTLIHLIARVGLTQDEILRASFSSRHIQRMVHADKLTNLADQLLFKYK
jgi:hypothetical protein